MASFEGFSLEELWSYLSTPYHDVYEISTDGLTYVKPPSLAGVPVNRIKEDDKYWRREWSSLSTYLSNEPQEEVLKAQSKAAVASMEAGTLHVTDPIHRKNLIADAKRHTDNVSKHRKIREGFADGPHPNQIVSKRYMPQDGLCDQETMYHLACKLSDLQYLSDKGRLAMKPFDFLRWRIGELLIKRFRVRLPGGKNPLRSVIHAIDGVNSDEPIFRAVARYSVEILQGRRAYGVKRDKAERRLNGMNQLIRPTASNQQRRRSTASSTTFVSDSKYQEEREEIRRERRADMARRQASSQAGSQYQGVNAYRRQMTGGGPCGG